MCTRTFVMVIPPWGPQWSSWAKTDLTHNVNKMSQDVVWQTSIKTKEEKGSLLRLGAVKIYLNLSGQNNPQNSLMKVMVLIKLTRRRRAAGSGRTKSGQGWCFTALFCPSELACIHSDSHRATTSSKNTQWSILESMRLDSVIRDKLRQQRQSSKAKEEVHLKQTA